MRLPRSLCVLLLLLGLTPAAFASAYNAQPKLVVVIVIDQFRGDYLERYRDQFGDGGFRLFLDHGAYFTDCNYDYANTRTAPGHATLFTGTYTSGHGIVANEWWDPQKKKRVTSVEDDATKLVGVASSGPGASPHNLLSDTLGDELKLATGGKARVFAISLKDRAAVLPAGFAGDGAYWIDPKSGDWITSTYYRPDLPEWVRNFNGGHRAEKYWNREWKDDATENSWARPRREAGKDGSASRVLRGRRRHSLRQRIPVGIRQGARCVREAGRGLGYRSAGHQPFGERYSWPPGWPRFSANAQHGARTRPESGGFLRLPRSSDRNGECVDGAFRRSWHRAAAGIREDSSPARRQSRCESFARTDQFPALEKIRQERRLRCSISTIRSRG